MPFDEATATRVRSILHEKLNVASAKTPSPIVEKKMFGGLAFMIHGHMCCGIVDSTLMARVGPEQYESALAMPHAREMDFTGRSLKGFVYVAPDGFKAKKELSRWVDRCVRFVTALPPK